MSMKKRHAWVLIVVCLFAAETRAATLGGAAAYGEFILGNSTRSNVNTQGRVAVGGNADFNNFSIGTQQISTLDNLVVGGTVNAKSATVYGNIYSGGNFTYNNATIFGNVNGNADVK